MKRDELLWWGGAALVGGLLVWQGKSIVSTVSDTISRGKRLTYTGVGPDGVVTDDPADLAAQAAAVLGRDLDQEIYDLARMKRSEQGNDDGRLRVHVALNDAETHGWSTHFTITYSTNAGAKGWYGEQYTPASRAPGGVASSRRYSTARDPYEGDVSIVELVLAERAQGLDPTSANGQIGGGAVKFVDKSSMGVQEGSGSFDDLVAEWALEGLHPFTVPGYPSDLIVFRKV